MIMNYLGHMITQEEFVNGCYRYYAENYYEPGNPEDGIWEDCHYPAPKCLGGTTTVKLLKQHHAVQGVLQSEEYQHPCVWSWERDYLEGDMLALHNKWKKVAALNTHAVYWVNTTPEERSTLARLRWKSRNLRAIQVTYPDGRVGVYPTQTFTALALGMKQGNISKFIKYNKQVARGIWKGFRFDYA